MMSSPNRDEARRKVYEELDRRYEQHQQEIEQRAKERGFASSKEADEAAMKKYTAMMDDFLMRIEEKRSRLGTSVTEEELFPGEKTQAWIEPEPWSPCDCSGEWVIHGRLPVLLA